MKIPALGTALAIASLTVVVANDDLIHEASATEFGSDAYGCADTVAMAKNCGINYRDAVNGCLQDGHPKLRKRSISLMLWLSAYGDLDAAGSQGHAAVIGAIIRKLGDEPFALLVADQPESMRETAGWDFLYDFGLSDGPDKKEVDETSQKYPMTFKALAAEKLLNQMRAERTAPEKTSQGDAPK